MVAQQVKNPTSIHEDASLIPGLAQWGKGSGIAMSCSVGGGAVAVGWASSCGSDSTPSLGTSACRG